MINQCEIKIATEEKCPECGGGFKDLGWVLMCEKCHTNPKSYCIDVQGNKIKADSEGKKLKEYPEDLLAEIKQRIATHSFNPAIYLPKESLLQFKTYVEKYLGEQKELVGTGGISIGTYRWMSQCTRLYYLPFFGTMALPDIKEEELEAFYLNLPRYLMPATKRTVTITFHKLLSDAKKKGLTEYIPEFPRFPHVKGSNRALLFEVNSEIFQKAYNELWPYYHRNIVLFLWKQLELYANRPGPSFGKMWI